MIDEKNKASHGESPIVSTGASRGLGSALVHALALQGCTVVLIFARNVTLAEQVRDFVPTTKRVCPSDRPYPSRTCGHRCALDPVESSSPIFVPGIDISAMSNEKFNDVFIC